MYCSLTDISLRCQRIKGKTPLVLRRHAFTGLDRAELSLYAVWFWAVSRPWSSFILKQNHINWAPACSRWHYLWLHPLQFPCCALQISSARVSAGKQPGNLLPWDSHKKKSPRVPSKLQSCWFQCKSVGGCLTSLLAMDRNSLNCLAASGFSRA